MFSKEKIASFPLWLFDNKENYVIYEGVPITYYIIV